MKIKIGETLANENQNWSNFWQMKIKIGEILANEDQNW